MSDEIYVLYAATYPDIEDAQFDYDILKTMANSGQDFNITAALVKKDDKGRLKIHETTHDGKVGAGIGAVAGVVSGAIIGAMFPPAGLVLISGAALGGGLVGGGVFGTIGHFAGGLSRKDLKELEPLLDEGQAAIIAVTVDAEEEDIYKAMAHAAKKANKAIDKGDVEAAITAINEGIAKAEKVAETE